VEKDFEAIAELLHKVLLVCKDVQAKNGKLLKDFTRYYPPPPHTLTHTPTPALLLDVCASQ